MNRVLPCCFGMAILLGAVGASPAHADDSRPIWLGFSGVGLVHHNSQTQINRSLQQAGYSSIGNNQPIAGGAIDFGIQRLRLTWDTALWGSRSYQRHSDGRSFSVRQANLSLDVGVNALQVQGFSLFPMVGLAASDLRLDVDARRTPLLADQIGGFEGDHEIRQNTWSARFLVGFEQRVPILTRTDDRLLLFFGMRLGYQKQFKHIDWILDSPDLISLHGGPTADLSGPFVRFALGLAGSAL